MSKLTKLLDELCPDGVEYKKLSEHVFANLGGGTPSKSEDEYWDGDIPWASVGDVNSSGEELSSTRASITGLGLKNSSTKLVPAGSLIVALKISPGAAVVNTVDVAINQDLRGLVLDDQLDARFLMHFLRTQKFSAHGTIVKSITNKALLTLSVPVPPLEVQQEIVRVLDAFTNLEQSLVSELELRKKQFEEYLSEMLRTSNSGWKSTTLGDIGSVRMCKRIMKHQTSPVGDVPFFKIGSFGGQPDAYIPRELFEEYRSKYSFPKVGDILISAAGTIGRTVKYDGEAAYFQDSNIVWLENDEAEVTNDYLHYWYKIINWTTDSGTIKRLYNKNLLAAGISYPNKAGQEEIVAKLDTFDSLIQSIKQEITLRRKQYEFYRDELLSFTLKED